MPRLRQNRSLGRGTGKAGRPTVTDLIMHVRRRLTYGPPNLPCARSWQRSLNGSRISVEMKPYEQCKLWRIRTLSQHVKNLRTTTQPDLKPLPRSQKNYSSQMTFYDVRSFDSSDRASTSEQHRKIRRPNTDNDDLSGLGSYTRTKPIPKKVKKVEDLKLQHEYEIKSLRAEMEQIRADQRRLQTEISSV